MFNLFKKKCPTCKMKLGEEGNYPEGFGKKFCSENCREEYRKKLAEDKEKGNKSHGCCH